MLAKLYLHPDNFSYNGTDTKAEVINKLTNLISDLKDIVYKYKNENKFIVSDSLSNTLVYQKENLIAFICNHLDPEEQAIFFSMMENVGDENSEKSLADLKQLCKYHKKEKEIKSLVILNAPKSPKDPKVNIKKDYITFDEYQVVYNNKSWRHLRRQILGNHPGTPSDFINECKEYFPKLIFHDNCRSSLSDENYDYLEYIPRKIIFYLTHLNDHFELVWKEYDPAKSNPNDILSDFSGRCGFDMPGSLEQNPTKKSSITFTFKIPEQKIDYNDVLCEPHFKLEMPDDVCNKPYEKKNFHPRLYFSYAYLGQQPNKLLIGSIGRHL